jgi:hypothetical protein
MSENTKMRTFSVENVQPKFQRIRLLFQESSEYSGGWKTWKMFSDSSQIKAAYDCF